MNNTIIDGIRTLRLELQAGMMECKNALTETGGDVAAARELLLERGCRIAEQKDRKI